MGPSRPMARLNRSDTEAGERGIARDSKIRFSPRGWRWVGAKHSMRRASAGVQLGTVCRPFDWGEAHGLV